MEPPHLLQELYTSQFLSYCLPSDYWKEQIWVKRSLNWDTPNVNLSQSDEQWNSGAMKEWNRQTAQEKGGQGRLWIWSYSQDKTRQYFKKGSFHFLRFCTYIFWLRTPWLPGWTSLTIIPICRVVSTNCSIVCSKRSNGSAALSSAITRFTKYVM